MHIQTRRKTVHLKSLAALCCALFAMGALSACGSDDAQSTGSAGGSSSSKPAAPALKGDPIVVGSICSCSGAQSAVLASVKDVNEAWAKSVNAKGGINGHPVKMIVEDDGGQPAKGLAAAKKLVEQDNVLAIVGELSLTDGAWEKYVTQKGVPVVGGLPIAPPFLKNPDFFTSGASQVVATAGTMEQAKKAGKKSVGVLYCAESPVCAQLDPLAKGAAKLTGLTYRSGKASSTAPNYTAPCLANKNAGVDALYVGMNSAVVQRVMNACAQQGYKPLSIGSTNTVGKDWLKNPNLDGAIAVSTNANPCNDSIPAVKDFHDALDEYAPGVRDEDGFGVNQLYPWAGGKLFEAAADAAKLTPTSTAADLKKGLYSLKNETLGGLAPPLTFTRGKPAFPTCYFTVRLEDGNFADGEKPACLTAQQTTALTSALKG
jgi:branched-chain amino acid transport system substrate-binding protein